MTTRFAALLPELLRPQYGVEAPYVPTGLAAGGVGCLTAASWRRARWLAVLGVAMFAQAGLYLHTTVRGKLRVWERELDRLNLRGDERLLDLGCGRGAVLIAAARRLPVGRAVGVDLWRSQDQSGNQPTSPARTPPQPVSPTASSCTPPT